MQDYFDQLSRSLGDLLQGDEVYTASFHGEESDFVRFNQSRLRQAGHVQQRSLSLDLIEGARHAAGDLTLSGDVELDTKRVTRLVQDLREKRAVLPEDPHLLYATEVNSSEQHGARDLPDAPDAIDAIQAAGQDRDLVGIYAAGGIYKGFASSLGQRNWFSTHSYNFDWSFYHQADKAVKQNYAGFAWEPAGFQAKVDRAAQQLEVLERDAHTIEPGRYRVYLSPAALYDIIGLLGWGGFGLKAHKTKQTPLLKMIEGDKRMAAGLHVLENTKDGVAPNFQGAGFLRPERVDLIQEGAFGECLVSPRSAKEYGVPTNGADASESPQSIEVAAGDVPTDDVLGRLGTGVYLGNVWYLNYSDRVACRTTGMTRFATFWVEDGEIKAPLSVMRFDETFYRMLGENLIGLTRERDLILDADTYFRRATSSGRMPGALVEDFAFTL
jgi:predicted Zn-dependent protease